jgi:hypothetical protein
MPGIRDTFKVLNRMVTDGIVGRYAVAGAVAALNYLEPTLTQDLDILIAVEEIRDRPKTGLVTLEPIFAYLRASGYSQFAGEGIVVEGWPVQFLPVASPLDAEGLAQAINIEIETDEGPLLVPTLRPEHIVATALRVGRSKDRVRIIQFLESDAVDLKALHSVLQRHNLMEEWRRFCVSTGISDPL